MKVKFLLIFLVITSIAFAQYPVNGLNAAYEFNGNVNDIANGNNMTIANGFMLYPTNRVNIPGSALGLLFGDVKRTDVLYPNSGSNNRDFMTYTFWVKTTLIDSNRRVIIEDSNRTDDADTDYDGSFIYMKNGKIGIESTMRFTGNDLRKATKEMSTVIADGEWHLVYVHANWSALSQSVTTRYISMSIDGNPVSTSTYSYARQNAQLVATYDQVADVAIGNNRAGDMAIANRYTNEIDDLLVYSRALSNTEIANIASSLNFCFVPNSNLITATNIQNTSADINIGDAEMYDVAYAPIGTPISQATIVNNVTSTTSLTGLNPNITYEVYIRRLCANTTSWSEPYTFRTTRTIGTLYVNANATGLGSGTSWNDAYTSLYTALGDATDGEEIWIAGGTYKPSSTGNRFTSFTINAFVKLVGGFAGTENLKSERVRGMNETILSGDLNGDDDSVITVDNPLRADNSYKVVNITITSNASTFNVELDRLTITGGNANATSGVNRYGAAISKDNAVRKLDLIDCTIKNNTGRFGTVYSSFGSGGTGSLNITRCIVDANYGRLGTLYGTSATSTSFIVTIENSQITNNIATDTSGNDGAAGSSMFFKSAVNSGVSIRIENSTIANNQDLGTAAGYNNFNRATIIAQRSAGPTVDSNATVRIYNSILYGNKTSGGLTARAISRGTETTPEPTVEIFNCIDENNFSNIPVANVMNSSNANPMFSNAANGDYTLTTGSPAISAGDNTHVTGTIDLLGNPRIFSTTVDLGAYEHFVSVYVSPIVYLQGAMLGASSSLMNDDLRIANDVPTISPYSDGATCTNTVFTVTGNNAIVDWIWVELRDATTNTTILDSQSALLQRDGDVVGVDGTSSLIFNQASGNYYIVLKHRNHLGIMTNNTISLSETTTIVDFTDANNQITYGTNAQTIFGMSNGAVAMWAGNVNGDDKIQYSGTTPDAPGILSEVLNASGNFLNFPTYILEAYNTHDINMDGNTQYTGTTPDTPFILQNVLAHPGNFLNFSTYQIQEQLPEN